MAFSADGRLIVTSSFDSALIVHLSRAARCIQVPQGKDVNEFYMMAGHEAVRGWVEGVSGIQTQYLRFELETL